MNSSWNIFVNPLELKINVCTSSTSWLFELNDCGGVQGQITKMASLSKNILTKLYNAIMPDAVCMLDTRRHLAVVLDVSVVATLAAKRYSSDL